MTIRERATGSSFIATSSAGGIADEKAILALDGTLADLSQT
jgi:hypothetical protein